MAGQEIVFYVDGNQSNNLGDGRSPQNAWKTLNHAISGNLTAAAVVTARDANDKVRIRCIGEFNKTNQSTSGTSPLLNFVSTTPVPTIWNPIIIEATPYLDGSLPDPKSSTFVRWDGTGLDYVISDNGQNIPNYIFRNIDIYRSPSDNYGGVGHGAIFASTSYGITFENCRFSNHIGIGVSSSQFSIDLVKCIIENCNRGSAQAFASRVFQAIDCQVISCNVVGLWARCENNNVAIPGTVIRDCAGIGLAFSSSTGAPGSGSVDRFTIYNCGTGLQFRHTTSTTAGSAHNFKITNGIVSSCTNGLDSPETEANKVVRPYLKDILFHNNTSDFGNTDPIDMGVYFGDPKFNDAASGDFRLKLGSDAVLADGRILGASPYLPLLTGGSGSARRKITYFPL